jgi:hypothetical protein
VPWTFGRDVTPVEAPARMQVGQEMPLASDWALGGSCLLYLGSDPASFNCHRKASKIPRLYRRDESNLLLPPSTGGHFLAEEPAIWKWQKREGAIRRKFL